MDGALEEASDVLRPEAGSVEFHQSSIHSCSKHLCRCLRAHIPTYSTSSLSPFIPTSHLEMNINILIL